MRIVRLATVSLAALGVAGSAATGFGGELLFDGPTGWVLLGHLAAAPLTIAGMTGVALIWGGAHRFDRGAPAGPLEALRKVAFWIMLLAALGSMITMLSAMLPVFGYIGQDRLREAHGTCGVGVLAAGGAYLALAAAGRARRSGRTPAGSGRSADSG